MNVNLPATRQRLRIKFGALLFILVLSFSGVSFALLHAFSNGDMFSSEDHPGMVVITAVRPLLDAIQKRSGLCFAVRKGETTLRRACAETRIALDRAMSDVESANLRNHNPLGLAAQIATLRDRWAQLRDMPEEGATPDQFFFAHQLLFSRTVELLWVAGDASRLVLDSNADAQYLADVSVTALPALIETLGLIRGVAVGATAEGVLREAESSRLAVLVEDFQRNRSRVNHALRSAVDSRHTDTMPWEPALHDAEQRSSAFLEVIAAKYRRAGAIDVTSDEIFSIADDTLSAQYKLYDAVLESLGNVLSSRRNQQWKLTAGVAVAVVMMFILALHLFEQLSSVLARIERDQSRLRALFDSASDGMIAVDAGGAVTLANSAGTRMLGRDSRDPIGSNLDAQLLDMTRSSEAPWPSLKTIASSAEREREIELRYPSGNAFPARITVRAAGDDAASGFAVVIHDLTKAKRDGDTLVLRRRQAETMNRIQARYLRSDGLRQWLEGTISDLVELTGSEFGLIGLVQRDELGKRCIRFYGLNTLTLTDELRDFHAHHAPPDFVFHKLDNLLGAAVLRGEPIISNNPGADHRRGGMPEGHPPLRTFLGMPVFAQNRLIATVALANRERGYGDEDLELLAPVLDACANLINAFHVDAERRRTAQALTQANDLMSSLFANLRAGVVVEDDARRIVTVNQTYCDLFGKSEPPTSMEGGNGIEEMEGNKSRFFDPEGFLRLVSNCIRDQKNIAQHELALVDGRILELEYVPVVTEDEDGVKHRTHIWSYRDITSRKRTERRLVQQAQALADAKGRAEAATRAKAQFLANMSHEIRTPLNGVLGMLYLLKKTSLTARQGRFVTTASSSGEMLLNIINDILDFSKIDAGKLVLELIPFDPVVLVEDVAALAAERAQAKGIELICSITPAVPRNLKGDPTRLRQVLTNMVNNAVKFTEHGEVSVTASWTEPRLRLEVRDTGIGMTLEQQQALFEAFAQADSSHTRKFGGTGLGLAISRRLVEAMGGRLHVVSVPAQGSVFSFEVPFEAVPQDADAALPSARVASLRVLIVDDNANNRRALRQLLDGCGVAHTIEAESASAALDQLRALTKDGRCVDVVLMDMDMPGMDGLEAARAIHAEYGSGSPRIALLTTVGTLEEMGTFDVSLHKPVRRSDLYDVLSRWVGESTALASESVAADAIDDLRFDGARVLLVDDNEVNQEVAKELLAGAGFIVDTCVNGAEAVREVQARKFDAVLMDIQMPVMDGIQATRRIRELGGDFANLPIIAMTAHAMNSDERKSMAAGMNEHIAKPIDPERMMTVLSRFVASHFAPRDPSDARSTDAAPPETFSMPLRGVDTEDGLRRMRGNRAAYQRALLRFHEKHANDASVISETLAHGDFDGAARLAHTLKGASGNVGAKIVFEASARLEQACRRADAPEAARQLDALMECLREVMEALAAIKSTPDTGGGAPRAPSRSAIRAVLESLNQSLDTDVSEAQAHIDALLGHTRSTEFAAAAIELEGVINAFEIDAAKSLLKTFLERCE